MTILMNERRTIEISYKIQGKEKDKEIMKTITDEAISNKLHCGFGEDDYSTRYIRISGINPEIIDNLYQKLKELLN